MKKMGKSIEVPTAVKLRNICLEFKDHFSDRLSHDIELLGISKKELASELGVHPSAISHWLNGSRLPSATTLYALTKVLELDGADRSSLIALWHLSLLADSLLEYLESALKDKDEDSARQIFVDLLQQNWGDLFTKEWREQYISIVQPEVFRSMNSESGSRETYTTRNVSAAEYISILENLLKLPRK
jgi:transcriptional regulator with XRE-family HTH domain